MKALILTNAYSNLKSSRYCVERLSEELQKKGVNPDICPNDGLFARVLRGGDIENVLSGYSFCIYLDKDKYTAYALEKSGIRLYNSRPAIELCDDKMLTHLALSGAGIKMPKTLGGLLCYTPDGRIKDSLYNTIEKELGYPVVVKESYGSLGRGVYKAENRGELEKLCNKLKLVPHLFQQYIGESAGSDIRVIVIGGECVTAMKRTSRTDFRSNLELGGVGEKYPVDEEMKKICKKASEILGLDYCGIDLLPVKDGYLLCEVNSNAFFGGIERATGVNVAEKYVGHILS